MKKLLLLLLLSPSLLYGGGMNLMIVGGDSPAVGCGSFSSGDFAHDDFNGAGSDLVWTNNLDGDGVTDFDESTVPNDTCGFETDWLQVQAVSSGDRARTYTNIDQAIFPFSDIILLTMKTIGLLGGMSWESTLEYYRILNQLAQKELGGNHSCPCIIHSFDFHIIQSLQHAQDWEGLSIILSDASKKMENSGADMLIICTNTMHKLADKIKDHIQIPLIHITDAVASEIHKKRINKVGLLGTKFTMEEDFYKKKLQKDYHIECIIPSSSERSIIHYIIYNELVKGIFKKESKQQFKKIIENLKNRGTEGIILGCTEIPLLIKQKDCKIPIFDTTYIHAKAAFKQTIK